MWIETLRGLDDLLYFIFVFYFIIGLCCINDVLVGFMMLDEAVT